MYIDDRKCYLIDPRNMRIEELPSIPVENGHMHFLLSNKSEVFGSVEFRKVNREGVLGIW